MLLKDLFDQNVNQLYTLDFKKNDSLDDVLIEPPTNLASIMLYMGWMSAQYLLAQGVSLEEISFENDMFKKSGEDHISYKVAKIKEKNSTGQYSKTEFNLLALEDFTKGVDKAVEENKYIYN